MARPIDLAARRWILERALANDGISTAEVARHFRQSLLHASKRLIRLREIGYLVAEERAAGHGTYFNNTVTQEGADYLKHGESRASRFDDKPLCAAMGYPRETTKWQQPSAP